MSVMTKAGVERYRRYYGGGVKPRHTCRLSCDYMTPKQLKELNGEVHTYQMNKPLTWEEFKAYPAEFQKEYLNGLIAEYNVNYTTLSEMLGVGTSSIKRIIEKNHLGVTFQVGHSMTGEQRKAWKKFLSQDSEEPDMEDSVSEQEKEPIQVTPSATMTRFSMTFQGCIDPVSIVNSLHQMLGKDAVGTLNIEFIKTMPLADIHSQVYNG